MNTKLIAILEREIERQQKTLDLIPSENYTSPSVRKAVGSVFMHKYAEGYPDARYYEGNENIDELEKLCIKMVKKVFGVDDPKGSTGEWHANVQVLSGSIANQAVYNAVLEPGDKILSMYLPDGGHLSHGWSYSPSKDKQSETRSKNEKTKRGKEDMVYYGGSRKVNFASKLYNVVQYKTDPKTGLFDCDFIAKLAKKERPKMIVTGGTAYAREIDYKRIGDIAQSIDAYYLADVAHEAGLIAGGVVASPFKYADFVTFTTHKTLRGPRGAVAMCKQKYADKLDRSVFPGIQGGPFQNTIAGITQTLFEADTDEFKIYSQNVVNNAIALAEALQKHNFRLVGGGTDKHLILIDLTNRKIGGKYAARALAHAGIVCNKNTVPYESSSPVNPSGIRVGTPTLTTRGMTDVQMKLIAGWIDQIVTIAQKDSKLEFEEFDKKMAENSEIKDIRREVEQMCLEFPLE